MSAPKKVVIDDKYVFNVTNVNKHIMEFENKEGTKKGKKCVTTIYGQHDSSDRMMVLEIHNDTWDPNK